MLTWRSASEEGFSHYDLERSKDGTRFEKIETINGKGGLEITQTYRHTDKSPRRDNYYRLDMIDLDGTAEYSSVVYISSDCDDAGKMRAYPNLVSVRQAVLNVNFFSAASETEFLIFNTNGQEMRRVSLSVEKNRDNTVRMDIAGLFIVSY